MTYMNEIKNIISPSWHKMRLIEEYNTLFLQTKKLFPKIFPFYIFHHSFIVFSGYTPEMSMSFTHINSIQVKVFYYYRLALPYPSIQSNEAKKHAICLGGFLLCRLYVLTIFSLSQRPRSRPSQKQKLGLRLSI